MLYIQIFISLISGTSIVFGGALLLSAYLFYNGYRKDFYKIFFSAATAMFVAFALKHLLKIPRPENMLVAEDGYRFPSGHATMAAVVSSLVIYYTNKYVKNKIHKGVIYFLAIFWYLLVSYSRLFLQVHLPVDVLAGGMVGLLSVVAVVKTFNHLHYYKK